MRHVLTEAKRVYADEGIILLGTKGCRKMLRPVVGENSANTIYYRLNNLLLNKTVQAFEFTSNRNLIGLEEDAFNSFFGFYDCTPFGPENNRVLYHRTADPIQPATRSNALELCYFDIQSFSTKKFAETNTWNWQKGCRLQWLPGTEDQVIYNREVNEEYGAVIYDLKADEPETILEHPIYSVSPNGEYATSLNYSRLERLHSDYGYTNFRDKTQGEHAPSYDGIYRIDLTTGAKELLVSYQEMTELTNSPSEVEHYAMNLIINPAGDRCAFLHRYHQNNRRMTNLLCVSANGEELTLLQEEDEASHPIWLSDRQLLTTINQDGVAARSRLVVINTDSGEKRDVNLDGIGQDIHPTIHPTQPEVIVGDTYPQVTGRRKLFQANLESGATEPLGSVYGPVFHGVKRDLHPRFDRKGKYLCVDLPRPKNRQAVYLLEMEQ